MRIVPGEERVRQHLEEARLRLVRLDAEGVSSLDTRLALIARIAARCLAVERVSVWLFDAAAGGLRALEIFDPSVDDQGPQVRWLSIGELGRYVEQLRERRSISAESTATDVATRDLAPTYFGPLGIVSTIDTPIYRDGNVVGVVCHEHRGALRRWSAEEIDFTVSVAEVIALEIATRELRDTQETVRVLEVALHDAMSDEAIARLARGVAHDVNNLLAVVISAAAVLRRTPGNASAALAEAEVIEEAAASASRLVRDLLAVGRAAAERGESELDRALHEAVPVLHAIASDRRLVFAPDAPGVRVPLAATRLEQVLVNLVGNAREATSEDGTIEVRTRVLGEGRVAIDVEDDGTGIDEDALPYVFEPYYSTRAAGRGLGLPTVLAIVRSAGGTVRLSRVPAGGTIARVELPIVLDATPS